MTVAEMIKQTRTQAHMTQEEYGLKFCVSRQTVSSWENGRSMPDLQMLIDICNTYHISLDRLLREDQAFVHKVSADAKIRKWVKRGAVCLLLGVLLFLALWIRWAVVSSNKNEAFAQRAAQLGFVLEGGVYVREEDGVTYQLPNQKLPFLNDDFFNQTSWATLNIGNTELEIRLQDARTFTITLDHYRNLTGRRDPDGSVAITENHLTPEEQALVDRHQAVIQQALTQSFAIYHAVYDE